MANDFIDSSNVSISIHNKQINNTVEFNNKEIFKYKNSKSKSNNKDNTVDNNTSIAEQMSKALRENNNYKKDK